jgi:hypothetical protein
MQGFAALISNQRLVFSRNRDPSPLHISHRERLSLLPRRLPTFFFFIVTWYPSVSLLSALRARAPAELPSLPCISLPRLLPVPCLPDHRNPRLL